MAVRGSFLAIVLAALAVSACDPFGLPATKSLEDGAAGMLGGSFEVAGGYTAAGKHWDIDLQVGQPGFRHVLVTSNGEQIEAITIGQDAYYRGEQFLARQLSGNPLGASLARAAGNAWWKAAPGHAPTLPDFTDGAAFRSTFLGSAVSRRTDNGGTVELSGVRADVYIGSAAPYPLQRLVLQKGVVVDSVSDAVLTYSNPGKSFHIAAPTDLIDFGNQSTLPPIYTVVSVDTSKCAATCAVSARLKNLGGTTRAKGPSTVTFTMADSGGNPVGSCQATVQPDVGYNATTSVSCTIPAQATNAAVVTAVADNPGRA